MSKTLSRSKNLSIGSQRAIDPAKPRFMRETLTRGTFPHVYMVTMSSMVMGSADSSVEEWVKKTGNTRWLVSYANQIDWKTGKEKREQADLFREELLRHKGRVFLDSGAHTFQNLKLKPTTGRARRYDLLGVKDDVRERYLESFINYCKTEGHRFDCYANFDYWPNSKLVYDMQKRLEKAGIYPFPVEHGDDGLRWFQKYIDEGYKFFGISKTLRWTDQDGALRFFEKIFNIASKHDIFLHGFAITDIELMFRFPWFSVDSSTWIKLTGYGNILVLIDGVPRVVHVTEHGVVNRGGTQGGDLKWAKDFVESKGFDFDLMRKWTDDKALNRRAWNMRGQFNIWMISNLGKLGVRHTGGEKKWKSLL